MIRISFDNVLVNDDDYLEIKNEYKMFDKTFYLGATPCNAFTLKVPSSYNVPNEVKIKMDDEDYATLIVDSYQIIDDNILKLNLVDKMVLFDKKYDASSIVPCTTYDILADICSTCNVQLGTNSFINDDIPVNYYDNSYTARDYISMIAEINGGYAQIGADGKLYLKQFNNTPITLDINSCENFKLGEKRKIERVVFDNGLLVFKTDDDETKETLYLNNENVYINTQETFDNIANEILNFEFYNFSTGNCEVNYNAICGDIITFTDGTNSYNSIAQYKHDYNGGWLGGYELNLDSALQAETKIIDDADKIKAIKITQDRQANEIGILIEDIGDQNREIADIRLKYNEILSRISDIADITTSGESSYASVNLLNVNASQPIDVKIRPLGDNIGYLYPNGALYPSSTTYLKNRILRFRNTTESEDIDWELPANLWYYNATTYDELELNYGDGTNGTVIITRRCEVNSNGVVSAKATPTTETYPYPSSLVLTDGDYTVSLLGYTNAYLYVQLMAKNIYTTQFYTQAETNSLIDQTANSIDLSVDQKLSNYSTTAQMNSAITLKANEITSSVSETYATKTTTNTLSSRISQTAKTIGLTVNNGSTTSGITITTTKEDGTTETAEGTINMNGLVSFTNLSSSGQTTINGANITTGTISADRLDSSVITTENFSAQNINASNITSGTLNVDRISANSITSNKINNLSASKISGGTITGIAYNNGSGTFSVSSGGYVNAISGKVGGWYLTSTKLYGTASNHQYAIRPYGVDDETAQTSVGWARLIALSDKNLKTNIKDIEDKYDKFFDDLKPKTFYFKEGIQDDKKHIGFIAQDILKSEKLINEDLSLIEKPDESKYYNLYKEELIALNTWQIQKLKQENQELKDTINELRQEINKIKEGK